LKETGCLNRIEGMNETINGSGRWISNAKRQFGNSVKWWRIQLGISQKELAWRAGLQRSYVCDIERGARNVTLESIERVARGLEVSTPTLFFYGLRQNGQPRKLLPTKFSRAFFAGTA
jgi:transcriptional regulator with XRE-family HTH domain